jgi:hypothetical protein
MSTPEGEVQSAVIELLGFYEATGRLWYNRFNNLPVFDKSTGRCRSMGKGAKKGIADILVLLRGKTLWLEIKRPERKVLRKDGTWQVLGKGYQSREQKVFEEQVTRQGAKYALVYSVADAHKIIEEEMGND